MENNKLSTGLTVWLWIIFVVNVLAAIGGIVVAPRSSSVMVFACAIRVVICLISVLPKRESMLRVLLIV